MKVTAIMGNGEAKYRVIFLGPAFKDFGLVDQLVKNLQDHCNLSMQVVTKMMRLAPLTVKNGVDLREAERYKRALEGMGARVEIEPLDGNGQTARADGDLRATSGIFMGKKP
jgi:Ribosomal protein L7/L12 C-terminal domain